jgi:HEAT repeat protein
MPKKHKIDRVALLIDALSAPSLRVRSVAVRGLTPLRDARAIRPIIESVRGLEDECEDFIPPFISEVMIALASSDDRGALIPFFTTLDASFEDLHPIVWHLTQEDRSAILSLAELYEDDIEPLKQILFGPYSDYTKNCVINILAETDTYEADHALIEVLQDREMDDYLVTEAADAMGRSRCRDAFHPLCAILINKTDISDDTRSAAAGALGRIGDPRAIAPLVAVLTDPDEDRHSLTYEFAIDALQMLVGNGQEIEEDGEN